MAMLILMNEIYAIIHLFCPELVCVLFSLCITCILKIIMCLL